MIDEKKVIRKNQKKHKHINNNTKKKRGDYGACGSVKLK